MFPKMNPKQMAQMMRQMGISSEEIPAEKVVIHKKGGSMLEISSPSVMAMVMGGSTTYQISGEAKETAGDSTDSSQSRQSPETSGEAPQSDSFDDDVTLVAQQAKVSREAAAAALKNANGNIAQAIVDARGE